MPYDTLSTDALKLECFPGGKPDSACFDSDGVLKTTKTKYCYPDCYSGDNEISYSELTTSALKGVCYPSGDPGANKGQICSPDDDIKNALIYAYDADGKCIVKSCKSGYGKNKEGTKCKKETDVMLYAIIGIIVLFLLMIPLML